MQKPLKFLLLVLTISGVHSASKCKRGLEKCMKNAECCTKECSVQLVAEYPVCSGHFKGESCESTEVCARGHCENKICECIDHGEECNKPDACCLGSICTDKNGNTKGKCMLPHDEECKTNDQCISVKCTGGKCSCHFPGLRCYLDAHCCEGKCVNGMCPCIGKSKTCKNEGEKVCCSKGKGGGELGVCKKIIPEGKPSCGPCLAAGEPCTKKEECCGFYCNVLNTCECADEGFECRTNSNCCYGGKCVEKDGLKSCRISSRPNGNRCGVDKHCATGRCVRGHCECFETGVACQSNAYCCHGICKGSPLSQSRCHHD